MKYPVYEQYKDSGVAWLGEVPVHWEIARVKHCADTISKGTTPSTEGLEFISSGPVRFIKAENIDAGRISDTPLYFIDEKTNNVLKRSQLAENDVLLVIAGATIGKTAIVRKKHLPANTNQAVSFIRPNIKSSSSFLEFWFHSSVANEVVWLNAVQSAQPNLAMGVLGNFFIPIPPIIEQEKIAAYLIQKTAQIDRLIEKEQALIAKLNEKRTALITRAVTKGLDESVPMKDSGVEWLGEVPVHWDTVKVRYCTGFITSGPRGWAKYFSNDGALFIRIANLSRNSISLMLDDVQKVSPPLGAEGERTSTKSGDVLVSITADLGSIAVVPDECENSFISQHIAIVRPEQNRILPKWLAFSYFSISGKAQLLCAGYGGTKIQLGLNDIKEVILAFPESLDEQSKIIKSIEFKISKIDELINKINNVIKKLIEYRTALITAAVTGKIDVRNFKPNRKDKPAREAA